MYVYVCASQMIGSAFAGHVNLYVIHDAYMIYTTHMCCTHIRVCVYHMLYSVHTVHTYACVYTICFIAYTLYTHTRVCIPYVV